MQQIAQKCRHVQPKIQKWIGEASESSPDLMGASRFATLLFRY